MPAGRSGLSWLALLLTASAVALQQQPQDGQQQQQHRGSPPEISVLQPHTVKHAAQHRSATPRIEVSSHQHFRDTDANPVSGYIAANKNGKNRNSNNKNNNNERAVATLAPAGSDLAGRRSPPARSAAGPSGSLQPIRARSLQDWEVEDLVLLATIDGKIHARDRRTGQKAKWVFTPKDERPIIDTIDHRLDNASHDGKLHEDDWLWIVEPSQDGAIYVFNSEGNKGMQRLPLTVKQLFELSPYASDEPAAVQYEAEQKRRIFTINAATGEEVEGPASSIVENCRLQNAFADERECNSKSYLDIGRTDYTVSITNRTSKEPICTIKYSEWGPNSRDRDLQQQYSSTMDNLYVYSLHDGRFYNVHHGDDGNSKNNVQVRSYNKVPWPVARVFDVARHVDHDPKDAPLVVLPQPLSNTDTLPEIADERVFVNATSKGAWYAMSENQYPWVASYAPKAQCYSNPTIAQEDGSGYWQTTPRPPTSPSDIIGIHSITDFGDLYESQMLRIGPPEMGADQRRPIPPAQIGEGNGSYPELDGPSRLSSTPVMAQAIVYALAAVLISYVAMNFGKDALKKKLPWVSKLALPPVREAPIEVTDAAGDGDKEPLKVAATVETATATPAKGVRFADAKSVSDDGVATPRREFSDPNGATLEKTSSTEDGAMDGTGEAKKKKTHRGARGGSRRNKIKNKNRESAIEEAEETLTDQVGRQLDVEYAMQPDESSQMEGSVTEVSNTVRLNNLDILKDSVLGYGSGGTIVYDGRFEGREVAVKQMLPQYYELVDQEVNMLRDSDDHPNVIRYFCMQKDSNFHYIALERCQASLFDLYKDGGNRDGLSEQQLQLVNQINSNVPAALQQLAAGLAHLHQLRIMHRDIKPQNILIAYPRKTQKVAFPRFVISDFGLCKTLPENMSTLMGTTGNAGTIGWKAPELIMNPKMSDSGQSSQGQKQESSTSNDGMAMGVKRAIDIFSLGCVFFYVLTNGCHPFDAEKNESWTIMRELNIKRNIQNLTPLNIMGDEAEEPMHLISWMLEPNPSHRPPAHVVLKHPFFWSDSTRLAFLCDVSDHFEREQRDPPSVHLQQLEAHASAVIPHGDFLARLDRRFVDTLGKQRKYQGGRMLDLLRALRNKKNHYADMPEDVKERVGPLPGGYLRYWTRRFPQLIVACYEVLRDCGLEREARFKEYMGFGDE